MSLMNDAAFYIVGHEVSDYNEAVQVVESYAVGTLGLQLGTFMYEDIAKQVVKKYEEDDVEDIKNGEEDKDEDEDEDEDDEDKDGDEDADKTKDEDKDENDSTGEGTDSTNKEVTSTETAEGAVDTIKTEETSETSDNKDELEITSKKSEPKVVTTSKTTKKK